MPVKERVQAQSGQCWEFALIRNGPDAAHNEFLVYCHAYPDHRGLHWASGTDRHKRAWRLTWR